MLSRKSLLVFGFFIPVVTALLFDFFSNICLGRGNLWYYITGVPLLINLKTYHDYARILKYERGQYETPARKLCEVFYGSSSSVGMELPIMVQKLEDGTAKRTNNLGYLRLTDKPFTCKDEPVYSDGYCGLGLGMPNADHTKVRPFMDQVLGTGDATVPHGTSGFNGDAWTYADILSKSQIWLAGRSEMLVGREPGEFFLQYIHEVALGLTITDELASEMSTYHEDFLFTALFLQIPFITDARGLRKQRKKYLDMYVDAIEAKITAGELTGVLASEDVLLASNGFLDALTFAAIPSLTGVMAAVMGAYVHNLGNVNTDIDWTMPEDIGLAVMEAVRSYPPVLGVPYVQDGTRFDILVGYSGYDFIQFGDDSHDYRIRFNTVQEYRDKSLNWADTAGPLTGKPGTSHICPARSLFYNLVVAFLEAMDVETWMEADGLPDIPKDGAGPVFWSDFNVKKV